MKEEIRSIVLSYGADLCGFAGIDRFDNAPSGFKPTDIYPDCKSVISFAIALPKGLAKVNPRLVYGHYNYVSCSEIDIIAFKSAKKLEKSFGCIAVPIPCDSPYEYWDSENMEGHGLLSMKHIAVQAGLGSLGKSSLFINKHYGNMVTLGAVLTNLVFPSDVISENICIVSCHKCIEACPVGAIYNGTVNQKLCRENTYGKTERGFDTVDFNKCRTVCPANCLHSSK
jgi:epoxyqueuosine reductase QueG